MNSPITGKPMDLKFEPKTIKYRGCVVKYHAIFWEDEKNGEQFTTTELDESNLKAIHDYWQSTRIPRKKENKTEKLLKDERNKYQSWLQQLTQCKMGRSNPDFKTETELRAKIELLKELQKKLL